MDLDGPVLLLSTGCLFQRPLPEIAEIAAQAGFHGLELIINDPLMAPGPGMDAVDAILPIRSLHAPFRRHERWGGYVESWRAAVALANSLPLAGNVTQHPPIGSEAGAGRWFARAVDLPLLLDARGRVGLSLENLPWPPDSSPFGRDPLDALVADCRARTLGLTLDVCHLGVSGRDPLRALDRVPHDLLANVHFSDARGFQEHLLPGQGILPLQGVLARLAERGYSRYITLEVQPGALPSSGVEAVIRLSELREWMEQSLTAGQREAAL
ncbi:sugar phosphate isomerase/epimerase [Desulfovibrio aminophilus]|nr:sugar phosphate isomerase/epimerase [Desulfovibrio aminophilus]MCM0755502.1 sugar phosphate isomerase/epimerase [Desulfovibrio aminophilus]